MKELHNRYHEGAAASFVEKYFQVQDVEAEWNTYRHQHQITSISCPTSGEQSYEKKYWRWIDTNHPGVYKNWFQWDNTKSFRHGLTKLGIYQKYVQMMEDRCNFFS